MKPFVVAFAILTAGGGSAVAAEPTRPNILFFFADDQRFDTLGCAGHPIVKTPTLDRLAADGVRFPNAFVMTAVCWVSRAVVLTGQSARAHAQPNAIPLVKPEALATSFPAELRKAGYRTGHFGKWHLRPLQTFKPAEHYDEFIAIGRNPYIKTLPDGTKRHETDLVCDHGIAFLKSQPRDKPFCLNLCFNASHAEDGDKRPGVGHYPWPSSVDGMYEDVAIPAPRLGSNEIFEAHPEFLKQSLNRERFFWGYDTPEKYTTNVRAYYRMISGIDHAVGRVLQALEESGLANNTIVVYMADNGYYLGDRGFQGKWSHFEESLRVPMIIRDPRAPKEARGRAANQMVLNADLPATFLAWAGVPQPKRYEGRSLAPLVAGEQPKDWRTHFFCEHVDLAPFLTWEGIRGERYVYARYFDQRPAFEFLHDLKADPDELKNFASDPAYAETLRTMRELCDTEMNARGGPLLPLDKRSSKAKPKGANAKAAKEKAAQKQTTE